MPANAPVEQLWSTTAHDRKTHALIRRYAEERGQFHHVYFGPAAPAPADKESNWVPTDPKRSFEVMIRAYAPTKALFEKQWRLPDIELLR